MELTSPAADPPPHLEQATPLRRRNLAASQGHAGGGAGAPGREHSGGQRKFFASICLTFLYLVAELVVGYGVGSLTLQADAWHMMSDLASLLLGYAAHRGSKAAQSPAASYGGARYEVVGALVNSVALLALSLQIALDALSEVVKGAQEGPQPELNKGGMQLVLYVGAGGLAVNIIGMLLFHDAYGGHAHGGGGSGGHGHAHGGGRAAPAVASHGHSHGSMNAQGVLLHLVGDALGSVAVIVSAAVMGYTELPYRHLADPLASLIIAALLAVPAWRLVRSSAAILLQRVPLGVDLVSMRAALLALRGVVAVHDLHVWSLRPGILVGSVHIAHLHGTAPGLNDAVKRVFHATGVHATTVQLEGVEEGELPPDGPAAGVEFCEDLVCGSACEAAACCPAEAHVPPPPPAAGRAAAAGAAPSPAAAAAGATPDAGLAPATASPVVGAAAIVAAGATP